MEGRQPSALVIHGWTILAHPFFLSQIENLADEVERLRAKDPGQFQKKKAAKRLAAIVKLAFDVIPQDPGRGDYRLGDALGADRRHWFRARFFQQYRLFFRFHRPAKIIVLAWVNDDQTLRAYESSDDAYRVFRRMLESGHPPDDWDTLVAEAAGEVGRLSKLQTPLPPDT